VAGPASSAPAASAPATSAAPSGPPRPRHSKALRTAAGTDAQDPPRPHTAASPRPPAPAPSPSARLTTRWPRPLKWAPSKPAKVRPARAGLAR
jgi:hypothetical protein